jgi:hypothetical protein
LKGKAMTGSKKLNVVMLATLLGAITGCGEKTKSVEAPRQSPEAGKSNDQLPLDSKKPATAEELVGKDAAFLDADYKFDITSLFEIGVCKGDIGLKLNANMGKEATSALFEIPKGKSIIDCGFLGGKVDLAEMLGAFSKNPVEQVKDPIVVKDNVISLKQLGAGLYDPPRPLLPSFIATKKSKLASLNVTETVTMKNIKDGTTASGTINVRTIGIDQTYKPQRMQRQFNKVLHFEVTNKGFQGADKLGNLLFDRMEFKISLDPLAILYVEFKGKVSDAMKAMSSGGGAAGGAGAGGAAGGLGSLASGPLIGALTKVIDVKLKLDLISMKGLEDSNTMAEEGSDDVGEEIGGKKTDDEGGEEDEE